MRKLSKITESVFDNIIARSKGEDIRKEDDVNLKNCNEISEYIKLHYIIPENYLNNFPNILINSKKQYILCLEFEGIHKFAGLSMVVVYDNEESCVPNYIYFKNIKYIEQYVPEFEKILRKDYSIKTNWIDKIYYITKKEYDIKNEDVIKLLDKMIEMDNVITIKRK